ncbi:hypothetical protein GPECTOR_5g410 [Gonium pectorale]|uniref:RRM domain-containing protein n=1 Tax=Gonium pectorale TaxID=33097 RepID=A0A150GWR6_GONPE|nr:hypothetical protein GPECTOR_5g410 [Gonium pectorale]|eukprot:KXZ54327.1 hypothetical protein GPECTOR_5g410 [Gonium pectorale]
MKGLRGVDVNQTSPGTEVSDVGPRVSSHGNWSVPRVSSECGGASGSNTSCVSSDGGDIKYVADIDRDDCGEFPTVKGIPVDSSARHLQLGNIGADADQQALEQLLRWFGPLKSVLVFPEAGVALAAYLTPQHAAAAKTALEGQALPCVTGSLPFMVQLIPAEPQQAPQVAAAQVPSADIRYSLAGVRQAEDTVQSNCDLMALMTSFRALGLPVPITAIGGAQPLATNHAKLLEAAASGGSDSDNVQACDAGHVHVRGGNDGTPSRHLFLAYVVQNVDQPALMLTFSPFGVVESVRVFPGLHYAFVNYTEVQSAVAAKTVLEGQVIPAVTGNKPLHMRYKHRVTSTSGCAALPQHSAQLPAQPLAQRDGVVPSTADPSLGLSVAHSGAVGDGRRDDWEGAVPALMAEGRPGRRLWVGNIPSEVTQEDVTLLFAPFGTIDSVRLFPVRNFAFVNYMWPQHAAAARAALNDRTVLAWKNNRSLLVRYPRDREPRNGREDERSRAITHPAAHPLFDNGHVRFQEGPSFSAYHHSAELGGRYLPEKQDAAAAAWAQRGPMQGLSAAASALPVPGAVGTQSFASDFGVQDCAAFDGGQARLAILSSLSLAPSLSSAELLSYLHASAASNMSAVAPSAVGGGGPFQGLGLQGAGLLQHHQLLTQTFAAGLPAPSGQQPPYAGAAQQAARRMGASAADGQLSPALLQLLRAQIQGAASEPVSTMAGAVGAQPLPQAAAVTGELRNQRVGGDLGLASLIALNQALSTAPTAACVAPPQGAYGPAYVAQPHPLHAGDGVGSKALVADLYKRLLGI